MKPDQVGVSLPLDKVLTALHAAGWIKDKEIVMSKRGKDVHVVFQKRPAGWPLAFKWFPWVTVFLGVHLDRCATQAQAINSGRVTAQRARCELVIHGKNGKIRAKDSHGNDPRRIKG